jgi:hypothetical protein
VGLVVWGIEVLAVPAGGEVVDCYNHRKEEESVMCFWHGMGREGDGKGKEVYTYP